MLRRTLLLAVACACAAPAFALYDPKPDPALAVAEGEWSGTLTYRDYQQPDRSVTLPTRLFVALDAPDALVLHYVFDDGPGKTVHSYERMRFDPARKEVAWLTGDADRSTKTYRIVSTDRIGDATRTIFSGPAKDGSEVRFTIDLGPRVLGMKKEEIDRTGATLLRNTFAFVRP